jgi:ribosome biogenesis GTPase / thiamine phosphate phosphatase
MNNEDLGYSRFFEENRIQLGLNHFSIARVISEFQSGYRVKNDHGEFYSKITGKQVYEASAREDFPAVGDWVAIHELNNEQAVIRAILPRQTVLKRTYGDKDKFGEKHKSQIIATNIDAALIVESVARDYNLNRFERYFAIAETGGVTPVLILNKIDLLTHEEVSEKMAQLKSRFPHTDILLISVVNESGLDALQKYICHGKTYCFLGSSGVGKSSLINKLLNENYIRTGNISNYSNRGKHTTTTRQMFFLKHGGIVIDNPGIREVGIAGSTPKFNTVFDEITKTSGRCKYSNCTHTHEPGCSVIDAVKSSKLDKEKYSNYLKIKKESEFHMMSKVDKNRKDRQFGKFIKKAKNDLKDLER